MPLSFNVSFFFFSNWTTQSFVFDINTYQNCKGSQRSPNEFFHFSAEVIEFMSVGLGALYMDHLYVTGKLFTSLSMGAFIVMSSICWELFANPMILNQNMWHLKHRNGTLFLTSCLYFGATYVFVWKYVCGLFEIWCSHKIWAGLMNFLNSFHGTWNYRSPATLILTFAFIEPSYPILKSMLVFLFIFVLV